MKLQKPPPFTSWKTIFALKRYRVAKFKQRRQIKTRAFLGTLQHVKIGGCTGLCFTWVARHRRWPGEQGGQRIDFMNTDQAWAEINLFAQFFNSAPALGSHADRIARVAPRGCGMRRGPWIDEQDYRAFGTTLAHFATYRGYHIVEMAFNEDAPNHICALHTSIAGLRFFDPNSGEYAVPPGKEAAFLGALTQQYRGYVSPAGETLQLTFKHLYFYHID